MTLARVSAWFNRIPSFEKDMPLLIVGGVAYTPRATLQEVQRGTSVGVQLQALVETGSFGTAVDVERTLAKVRLEKVFSTGDPNRLLVATLGTLGRTYTTAQLLDEIRKETPLGQQWIAGEISHMRTLMR
jgi:hypothetical protein